MLQLPLNDSQIQALAFQRGEREEGWTYEQNTEIPLDPQNFVDPIERAIGNIREVQTYAQAVTKWIGWGNAVLSASPENLLPNIHYDRKEPFSNSVWGNRKQLTYSDQQQESFAAEHIFRSQTFCMYLDKGRRDLIQVKDWLQVATEHARERPHHHAADSVMLGKPTITRVAFDLTPALENVAATVLVPGGIDGPQAYAESIVERLLFQKADS